MAARASSLLAAAADAHTARMLGDVQRHEAGQSCCSGRDWPAFNFNQDGGVAMTACDHFEARPSKHPGDAQDQGAADRSLTTGTSHHPAVAAPP